MQLVVFAQAIKFLIIGVVVQGAVPVVDANAQFYHICYITVHMLK